MSRFSLQMVYNFHNIEIEKLWASYLHRSFPLSQVLLDGGSEISSGWLPD